MTIWQRINLAISNSGISKDCYVFILMTINFGDFFKILQFRQIKSSPIINGFTVVL